MAKKTKSELKVDLSNIKTIVKDVTDIRQGLRSQIKLSRAILKKNESAYSKQGKLIEAAKNKMIRVREQIKKAA